MADFHRRLESWDFECSPSQVDWKTLRDLEAKGELPNGLLAKIENSATVSGWSPDGSSCESGGREAGLKEPTRTAKLTDSSKVALKGSDLRE
jgi:hypothetical protein